ncbi:MAG: ribonuclease P protein component [Phycisphaeraceae bacterium]|nr:ribonuclease P protein component [Phycisphaeraceae bacterium]
MPTGGASSAAQASGRSLFRRRHRLTHAHEFQAVFDAKVRKVAGPLVVFAKPNDLPHCRLGLSVGRVAGNAVSRNRIKRLVREAFRLDHTGWPGPFDVVVNVRANARAMPLEEVRAALSDLLSQLDREWARRQRRAEQREGGTG